MRTDKPEATIRTAACALLLAIVLAGCDKPAPPPAPEPVPPPTVLPEETPPPPEMTPPPPEVTPDMPAHPTTDPPSPVEPSAVPQPAAKDPELDSMMVAKASAKLSVAVGLRYSFDGDASQNQPVTLHLAALPRVDGTNLRVSVKDAPGLRLADGPLNMQKAGSSSVYRKNVSVTALAGSPRELRVLVTMNVGPDLGFGYFTIPLPGGPTASGTNPQKQESVKQR